MPHNWVKSPAICSKNLRGGGPKYYLYTIKIFFMKLPKQPKERFPNIYFTFADPETRFFDLKKYFVNLVSV